MTEAMMKPDRSLADRLADVRCHTLRPGRPGAFADWDANERAALLDVALGSRSMSATHAANALHGYRATVAGWMGIDDDTLLDDLAAWIERCAKPPFDPAPYAEALIADIAGVTRERLGGLSRDERIAVQDYVGRLGVWTAHAPYGYVAHAAVRAALRDLG